MPDESPPVEAVAAPVADVADPQIEELALAVPERPTSTYMEAIEFGKVAAMSNLYPQAHNAARAAMVAAMGAALGVPFPIALSKIHILEHDGKITFIIEGALLGALINQREGIAYKVVTTTDEEAEIEFLKGGEQVGPNCKWDVSRATRAGLWGKNVWKKYPNEMLRWRALAEGTRLYFPEVIAGGAVYVEGEIDDGPGSLAEALTGPPRPPALADAEAEEIREQIEEVWKSLAEVNPDRMSRDRMRAALARFGHSHVELRQMLGQMEDLLADEKELQGLIGQLREKEDEKVVKEVVARAERRGSPGEKLDVLRAALADEEPVTDAEVVPDGD